MGFLQRDEHPTVRKARKRIDRVSQSEALLWADNAGSQMARCLFDFQQLGDVTYLEDAREAALMLQGCIESLVQRQG